VNAGGNVNGYTFWFKILRHITRFSHKPRGHQHRGQAGDVSISAGRKCRQLSSGAKTIMMTLCTMRGQARLVLNQGKRDYHRWGETSQAIT